MNLTNPGFLIVLLLIAVLTATAWAIYRQKKLPRMHPVYLLRLATLIIFLFLVFEPTFSIFEKKEKPYLAVLIDTSKSMDFSNRIKEIKNFISKNLSLLQDNYELDFYQFSKIASPFKQDELSALKANGNATNIYYSLGQAAAAKNYDGIILFSDGIDNSSYDTKDIPGSLGIPVLAFSQSEEKEPRDVSIANIRVSDFVFKNIPAEVTAGVYASGYYGGTLNVRLSRNKEIVSSKQVLIDKPYKEISFEFTSSRLGVETYNVEASPLPGETILTNNERSFTVETIREKIRILYICGQPSPEYYYLRYSLKSNPSVELVSFVILRNPEDVAVVPDEQLSLIPFPQNEIFTRDLFDYDILILDNFDYARFGIPSQYLPNIKKFVVEKGGGFLMIGGKNAFGRGAYAGTVIEEMLPVILDKPDENLVTDLFKLKFVNFTHPITNISEEGKDNARAWNELPEVDGSNRLAQKPGATVIAQHPSLKALDKNLVCIACQEAGKGKTMAIGINTTWRWLLQGGQEGKSPALYTKFWENVVYWLSGSQQSKEFRISLTQKNYLQGEETNFKIIVLNDALKKKKPFVTITDPLSKITQTENLRPAPRGWAGSLTTGMPGEYIISAQIEKGRDLNNNRIIIEDKKYFEVLSDISSEDYELRLNPQVLKDIAGSTGGMYFSSLDYFPQKELMSILKKNTRPVLKKRIALAANPLFYFAILILLIAEWVIRKIKGLI